MFVINEDLSIYVTRGDMAFFQVSALKNETERYMFQVGDVIRFKVFEKKACENVAFQKDVVVDAETDIVEFVLTENETKIGEVISKPTDYWYEVELNPLTNPQTIIGYDDDGAKIFKLFPEGNDIDDVPITPEDIPLIDEELSLTSKRPVANYVISGALVNIEQTVEEHLEVFTERLDAVDTRIDAIEKPDLTPYATKTEVKEVSDALEEHEGFWLTCTFSKGSEWGYVSDDRITTDTMFDFYASMIGVYPINVEVEAGLCNIQIEPQTVAFTMKVRCF